MKTIKNHKYSIGTAACGIVCILVAILGARDANSIELSGIVEPAYRATPHQTAIASGFNSVVDANIDNFRAVATAIAPAWPYWDYQSLNEPTYRGYGYEWIGRLIESRKLLHIIGDDPEPQSPDPLNTQSGAYYSGAGYLEFGIGYQPTPGTRQGLLYTSPDGEQGGSVAGKYAFTGYEHGTGLVSELLTGDYSIDVTDGAVKLSPSDGVHISGSSKPTNGAPMFGSDTRLFVDGLGLLEFSTKNPALQDYQGMAFSRERAGSGIKDEIGFIGMGHGDGLWMSSATENVKIGTQKGTGAGLYLTEESAVLAKDKAHFAVADNLIGVSYSPSVPGGVGSTGLGINFFIGDTDIFYTYEFTPSTPVGAGTPTPTPNAKSYAYSVGDYGHRILNLKAGNYGQMVTYDTATGNIGYASKPSLPTPQPMPNTPTPIYTGTASDGDYLRYDATPGRWVTGNHYATPIHNASQLQGQYIHAATPEDGDYLRYGQPGGTGYSRWHPASPLPTATPTNTPSPLPTVTPQAIPDTPTPYHVPVEMTPEPTISHVSLESILGDPDELPDGSHYFITDGDTYLYSVAIADARFFVSGYTPVALPTPTPTPVPDYIVSKAGTTAVNGDYFEDGTSDGVPCYSLNGAGDYWLHRFDAKGTKYWAIHTDTSDGPPNEKLYYKEYAGDTPYLAAYDIGTGAIPGADVSTP